MGTYAQTIGTYAQTIGTYAQTIGTYAQTIGTYALMIRTYTQTTGTYAQTIGTYAQTIGTPLLIGVVLPGGPCPVCHLPEQLFFVVIADIPEGMGSVNPPHGGGGSHTRTGPGRPPPPWMKAVQSVSILGRRQAHPVGYANCQTAGQKGG